MHDCYVTMKDGRKFQGPIWLWRPAEGYFTMIDGPEPDGRIELKDVLTAEHRDERVSIHSPPEGEYEDDLARARRDGWTG